MSFAHKKSLGQHFLNSDFVPKKMCDAGSVAAGDIVLEIGPGTGVLTREILSRGAKVLAVEADTRAITELEAAFPDEIAGGRLVIFHHDARKLDMVAFGLQDQQFKVIANIPYYISGLLFRQCLESDIQPTDLVFLVQKEVAERICAKPGDKHYGRLAVLAASTCDAHLSFTLPPGAFNPPPKVDSAVTVLHPLPHDEVFQHIGAIETVAAAAFGQRRKMLRAALKSLAKTIRVDATSWLEACEVDPTVRAETIDQNAFRRLATYYAEATQ